MSVDSAPGAISPDEIVEAWRTNTRINHYLIDRIDDEGMACTLSRRGGRDVCRQFAHMHNVRVWHLEKRAKSLLGDVCAFERGERPERPRLIESLRASDEVVANFLSEAAHGRAGVRAFKKGVATTLSYFIAHESHHRGSILLTLKQSGHKVDKAASYAIWDWDRR